MASKSAERLTSRVQERDRRQTDIQTTQSTEKCAQGAAEKSGPLNFFAVFSATVWDFNMKFYSFIY